MNNSIYIKETLVQRQIYKAAILRKDVLMVFTKSVNAITLIESVSISFIP